MRHYELVVVLSPILSPEESSGAWERIKQLITQHEGDILQEEQWGMRRLAYPIRRGGQTFLEGNYLLTRFGMDRVVPGELETHLRLGENILRFLLVKSEAPILPKPEEAAAAQAEEPQEEPVAALSEESQVEEEVMAPQAEEPQPVETVASQAEELAEPQAGGPRFEEEIATPQAEEPQPVETVASQAEELAEPQAEEPKMEKKAVTSQATEPQPVETVASQAEEPGNRQD